jgi:hypothetical protein
LYDVSPGASGSIFKIKNDRTTEEVAVWQESYIAHINKHQIIGETYEGLDLYACDDCHGKGNIGLPIITIEAANGITAFDDLEIKGTCDGKQFSVPRRIIWKDNYEKSDSQEIMLPLECAIGIASHSEVIEITARQISTGGTVVFRYRFARVPIKRFKLMHATVENGIVVANYLFTAGENIKITDMNGTVTNISEESTYVKRTLLKDEFLPLKIKSADETRCIDAKLALAAVDVSIPEDIAALSRKRPICLADALKMGLNKGDIQIKALGWRYNRTLFVKAGNNVLYAKELKRPTETSINLFSTQSIFKQQANNPRDIDLIMSIGYGIDWRSENSGFNWTDIKLLRCREGVGFKTLQVFATKQGLVIRFDKPVLCNLDVLFKRTGRREQPIEKVPLTEGAIELALPDKVTYLIHTKRNVAVVFTPKTRMGIAREEYQFEIHLKG